MIRRVYHFDGSGLLAGAGRANNASNVGNANNVNGVIGSNTSTINISDKSLLHKQQNINYVIACE